MEQANYRLFVETDFVELLSKIVHQLVVCSDDSRTKFDGNDSLLDEHIDVIKQFKKVYIALDKMQQLGNIVDEKKITELCSN